MGPNSMRLMPSSLNPQLGGPMGNYGSYGLGPNTGPAMGVAAQGFPSMGVPSGAAGGHSSGGQGQASCHHIGCHLLGHIRKLVVMSCLHLVI